MATPLLSAPTFVKNIIISFLNKFAIHLDFLIAGSYL